MALHNVFDGKCPLLTAADPARSAELHILQIIEVLEYRFPDLIILARPASFSNRTSTDCGSRIAGMVRYIISRHERSASPS